MDLKSVRMQELYLAAPKDVQNRAMKIGMELLPSANAELQAQQGFQQLALETSKQAFAEQDATNRLQLAQLEADARFKNDPEKHTTISKLLHDYDAALTDYVRSGPTLTGPGQILKAQSLNAIADELAKIAPDTYGPSASGPGTTPLQHIKPGENPGATSKVLNFLGKTGLLP